MTVPEGLKYTKEHEWVRVEGNVATIGITDYAQGELGDIVFITLPAAGSHVRQMAVFGTVEAVKTVSDLYSPVTGTVVEVNGVLSDRPETANEFPYEEGWMIRVELRDPGELDALLTAASYRELIGKPA
jgi:glycine cleavage system H protein